MSSVAKQVLNVINKYKNRHRTEPLEVSPFNEDRGMIRIDTDNQLNIRLHKVENGWLMTTIHQMKDSHEITNRVIPEGGDVMAELEQAIALHKIRM